MLKFIRVILVSLLALIVTSASADSKPASNFTDPSKTISVSPNAPQFTVTLRSNPTTGYTWFVNHYDSNLVTVVTHQYHASTDKHLIGSGGVDIWTFKLTPVAFTAPHAIKITMFYARPWDIKDSTREVTFNIASTDK